jgi:putative ABC transport system ATP-binding protein
LLKDPDILILDEATSALDAESETLVNQAVGVLLKGHNTTISIAHRLSTIKRSDRIIVIDSDGTVAEEGSYEQLSANKDGAFTKLMEWQLSGEGEVGSGGNHSPVPTEEEEIEFDLEADDNGNASAAIEGEQQGTKTRTENVSQVEAVAERVKDGNK